MTISFLIVRLKSVLNAKLKTARSVKMINSVYCAKEGCFGMRRRKNALLAITGVSNVLKREIIA